MHMATHVCKLQPFLVTPGLPGFKELMSAMHEVEEQLKAGMPASYQCDAQPKGTHQKWEGGSLVYIPGPRLRTGPTGVSAMAHIC